MSQAAPDRCEHARCPHLRSSPDHDEAINAVPDELDRYAPTGEPRADGGDLDMFRQAQALPR